MCKKRNCHWKIWIKVQMDIQTASGGGRTSSTTIFSSTYGLSLSKWVCLSPLSERLIWSAILPSSDTKHQPCEERERNVKTIFPSCIHTYNDTVNLQWYCKPTGTQSRDVVSANNIVMLNSKWKKSFFPHATTTIEDVRFGPELSLLSEYFVGFMPLTMDLLR